MDKKELKIVFVGSVDHGKSTLIGRLLYETKSLNEDKIKEIELASKELGRDIEWSFILDSLREEREQNITIDTTQIFFKSAKRNYVIIDAPGHVEFIKNMITGASQADLAILMIDANEGIMEQTRRHSYLLSLIGVKEVMVIVNKMDLVNYDQKKFSEIESEINEFFAKVGIRANKILPISARFGVNLKEVSKEMGWCRESFLDALDNYASKEKVASDFVMPIQDVYKINDKRIIVGKISSGSVVLGDEILIWPRKTATKVKSIEKFLSNDNYGLEGESVGLTTVDPLFTEPGDIISGKINSSLVSSNNLKANIFWLGSRVNLDDEKFIIRLATQEFPVKINVLRKFDSSTLNELPMVNYLEKNEAAEVTLALKNNLVFSDVNKCPELGRFVLEKDNQIVAVGIISI